MASSLCKERINHTSSKYLANTTHGTPASKWSDLDYAYDFLSFINDNPTEFHATKYVTQVLEENGFKYLPERSSWTSNEDFLSILLGKGGKFYTTRNGSSLVAFVVGPDWQPSDGVGIVGAHIDAITAKLKPISLVSTSEENGAYIRLGVAPYSGALSDWWLDRDLGLAGRIIVKTPEGKIESKLVKLDHPIGRIPTLAPHFGEVSKTPYNKETQMVPLIGLESSYGSNYDKTPTSDEARSPVVGKHDIRLLRAIAKNAGVSLGDILQVELQLYNFQPGQLGGLDREFIFAPRLDDKLCLYAALQGLLESTGSSFAKDSPNRSIINLVAFFDNEEVGSLSRQGARGTLLQTVVQRIIAHYETGDDETTRLTYANSFFVSADTTHAVNPNVSIILCNFIKDFRFFFFFLLINDNRFFFSLPKFIWNIISQSSIQVSQLNSM